MNPFTLTDLYSSPSAKLADLIPDCVPDGWWVWFGVADCWYASFEKPGLDGCKYWNHGNMRFLPIEFFPELYAYNGPIESCCIQVTRQSKPEQSLTESELIDDLKREQAEWPDDSWLPNSGFCAGVWRTEKEVEDKITGEKYYETIRVFENGDDLCFYLWGCPAFIDFKSIQGREVLNQGNWVQIQKPEFKD